MAYIKKRGYITLPGKPDVTYQFIHKVISYLSMFISFLRWILDIRSKRTKSSLAQLTDYTSCSHIGFHLHTLIEVNRN